jgi:hypothetical protein
MTDPPQLPDDRNPHLQIQQELKGDRDRAIGQAIVLSIVNFAGDYFLLFLSARNLPSAV